MFMKSRLQQTTDEQWQYMQILNCPKLFWHSVLLDYMQTYLSDIAWQLPLLPELERDDGTWLEPLHRVFLPEMQLSSSCDPGH